MLTVDYDRLGVRAGDRVLDVGCGAGRHTYEALDRGASVVALDADGAGIKEVGAMFTAIDADGTAIHGDVVHLPFADGAFDRIIASEVLEHVGDDRAAMYELARVLRPGGTLAATVPRWYPELVNWALSDDYHMVEGGHVRIYRRSALVARLRSAGLRVTGQHHAHALHSPYWWLKCLVGVRRDDHPLVRAYHGALVWDITHPRSPLRLAERALNPLLGKSLVVYAEKPAQNPEAQ